MKKLFAMLVVSLLVVPVFAASEAEEKTVEGELIDLTCFTKQGARGDEHRECASNCAKRGQPIGVLDAAGEIFVVLAASPKYAPYMADMVRITGATKEGTISPAAMEVKSGDGWTKVELQYGAPVAKD